MGLGITLNETKIWWSGFAQRELNAKIFGRYGKLLMRKLEITQRGLRLTTFNIILRVPSPEELGPLNNSNQKLK